MLVKVDVSLEEKVWGKLDRIAKSWNMPKSKAYRKLFGMGINELKLRLSKRPIKPISV